MVARSRRGSTGSLFVIDLTTRRAKRLDGPVQDWSGLGGPFSRWPATSELAWSPDSRKIAFAGPAAVETININGTDFRKLVRIPQSKTYTLVWSPDGRQIAFTVQHIFTCGRCGTY